MKILTESARLSLCFKIMIVCVCVSIRFYLQKQVAGPDLAFGLYNLLTLVLESVCCVRI